MNTTYMTRGDGASADRMPAQAERGSEEGSFGIRGGFNILRRRAGALALTMMVCTAAAWVAAETLPKVYTASATLVLERHDTRLQESVAELEREAYDRVAVETEMDVLRSRIFAGGVVDALDLTKDPGFAGALAEALGASGDAPAVPDAGLLREAAITALLSRIGVDRGGESLAISVSARDGDPALAARLANGVASHYVDLSIDVKTRAAEGATRHLQERQQEVLARIQEAEAEIARFSAEHGVSPAAGPDPLRTEHAQISAQLTAARVRKAAAETRLEEIRALMAQSVARAGEVVTSPLLASLRSDEARLLRERAEIASTYGARHPKVQNIDAELVSTGAKIAEEIRRVVLDLENELRVETSNVERLEVEAGGLADDMGGRGVAQARLAALTRELDLDRARYEQYAERLATLYQHETTLAPSARIASPAVEPDEPTFPRPKSMIAGALVGSGVLGFMVALLAEALDDRIRESSRVMQLTGLQNLAYVPNAPRPLIGRRRVPFHHQLKRPLSAYSEAARTLYLGCRTASPDDPPQVILLTSCLPGEGKTSLAATLAAAAAAAGREVLLIDLDLHRRGIVGAVEMTKPEVGLEDVLLGDATPEAAIREHPERSGLHILAPRRRLAQPSVLLASEALRDLIGRMREDYDLVILDTPPVLALNDATWLAPSVDAAVMVVRWGVTREDALREAMMRLHVNRMPVIGTVINGVDPRRYARLGYTGYPRYHRAAEAYYVD